ncbi:hypothetical protein AB4851_14920 [Burkholderia sp. 22PA0099]|uniref:hypothetical protein n=1 Tax=Burkholderia sp. 22PA0099 TaxID=3237372 RepID=UPI0039C2919C
MPTPKNFSPITANGETYTLDPARPNHVILYRFGNAAVPRDWLSRMRQAHPGGFPMLSPPALNEWALKQTSYGSQAEGIEGNPFVSVATSYQALYDHGEGWVQKIIQNTPNLVSFSAPFNMVFRPSPTKLISKSETEWLYYDGVTPMLSCDDVTTIANPLAAPAP